MDAICDLVTYIGEVNVHDNPVNLDSALQTNRFIIDAVRPMALIHTEGRRPQTPIVLLPYSLIR